MSSARTSFQQTGPTGDGWTLVNANSTTALPSADELRRISQQPRGIPYVTEGPYLTP